MGVQFAGNILVQSNGGPLPIAQGGTGQTSATSAINALLPSQGGNANKVLKTDGTNVSWVAAAGTPGGADTQIQYNDAGSFGGSANLVINKSTGAVTGLSTITALGLNASGAAASSRLVKFQTAGSDRWFFEADATPESGSNAGSNFAFTRVADNGSTTNQVFTVLRSSGVVDFKTTPTVNGTPVGANPSGSNTQIQYNDSGAFAGSSKFTWTDSSTTLQLGADGGTSPSTITTGAGFTLNIVPAPIISTNPGGAVNVTGGTSSRTGGAVNLTGGAENTSGYFGGSVVLRGGNGVSNGAGAKVVVEGAFGSGSSGAGNGGSFVVSSGPGTSLVERFRILNDGSWSVGSTGTAFGTSGQVLTSNGTGAAPTWQTTPAAAAGSLTGSTLAAGVTSSSLTTVGAGVTDGTYALGWKIIPQNATGSTTLTLSDSGKHIFNTTAAQTYTIPANSSVAYPIGTALTFINQGSGTSTIAITTDTMYLAGAGTTGSRTLAAYGVATAIKITSTSWIISGTGLT